jgi:hypothetical protein
MMSRLRYATRTKRGIAAQYRKAMDIERERVSRVQRLLT